LSLHAVQPPADLQFVNAFCVISRTNLRRVDSAVRREPSTSGESVLPHHRNSIDCGFRPALPAADRGSTHVDRPGVALRRRMDSPIQGTLVRRQAAGVLPGLAISFYRSALVDSKNTRTSVSNDPKFQEVLTEYRRRIEAEGKLRQSISRQEWLRRRDEF